LKQMRDEAMANLGPATADKPKKVAAKKKATPSRRQRQAARKLPSRGRDLNLGQQPISTPINSSRQRTSAQPRQPFGGGGGGGGGAIDPITGLIAAGLAGAAAARRNRKGVVKSATPGVREEQG